LPAVSEKGRSEVRTRLLARTEAAKKGRGTIRSAAQATKKRAVDEIILRIAILTQSHYVKIRLGTARKMS